MNLTTFPNRHSLCAQLEDSCNRHLLDLSETFRSQALHIDQPVAFLFSTVYIVLLSSAEQRLFDHLSSFVDSEQGQFTLERCHNPRIRATYNVLTDSIMVLVTGEMDRKDVTEYKLRFSDVH